MTPCPTWPRRVFDKITSRPAMSPGRVRYLMDCVGGSGKGYVIEALLAWFRLRGDIAVALGSCGQAASLLAGGSTLHAGIGLFNGAIENWCAIASFHHLNVSTLRRAKVRRRSFVMVTGRLSAYQSSSAPTSTTSSATNAR